MLENAEGYLAAGMNDVLTKPINSDKLQRTIMRLTGINDTVVPLPSKNVRIDGSMISRFCATIGDDKLDELIELFRTSGRDTIEEVFAAATRDDVQRCAGLAHRLKGGALNLGLTSVSDAAVALKNAIAERLCSVSVTYAIDDLAEAYTGTIAALGLGGEGLGRNPP